jgi:Flp pilus assembly protein TadG
MVAVLSVRLRLNDSRPRCSLARRGATAVEAALVLPLLSLLLLMCADLGRAIHAQIVLTNAVRTGAEYGALHRFTAETRQAWEERIEQSMRDEIASIANADLQQLAATIETTDVGPDELRIEVSGSYPFPLILAWPGFPDTLQLTHSVTMRQYR